MWSERGVSCLCVFIAVVNSHNSIYKMWEIYDSSRLYIWSVFFFGFNQNERKQQTFRVWSGPGITLYSLIISINLESALWISNEFEFIFTTFKLFLNFFLDAIGAIVCLWATFFLLLFVLHFCRNDMVLLNSP